jgi:DNA replication protein DnaC
MKDYALDNFDPGFSKNTQKAFAKVMDYIMGWKANQEGGRGLYFCGPVGVGKTHLAVAVMNEIITKKRVPSLFVTVPELLDNMRGAYNDPGRDIDEWMDSVKNADLLLLDDLGAERANEWVRQLGERTASRIIAMCDWISLEGEDYREAEVRRGL